MMEEPREIGGWVKISDLGSGGFGVVSLWKNHETSECIAIKKCKWHLPTQLSTKQRERWTNEVNIMKQIHNDNIVSFKTLPNYLATELMKYNASKLPLLSMEYCSRGNLRHVLVKAQNACGLPEVEVRFILKDLTNAISYLHNLKITHRDIKPENIVLQNCALRSNKTIYKLIDLGYAKEIESVGASFVGTLQYLAPEMFINDSYTKSVDYWSFGVVVFEIICGVHPFLPKLPAVLRFKHIAQKSAEDICIYESRSGAITFSQHLLPENQIAQCFAHNIETWLRLVLRYESKERGLLTNGSNIFTELTNIINKRIITIFSIYNYAYFYYEYDAHTLMHELQLRIEKDTKIPTNAQLLIKENMYALQPDAKLIECADGNNLFALFHRSEFVHGAVVANFPAIVKKMFENPALNQSWENVYTQFAHSINYILNERNLLNTFKKSFVIQLDYLANYLERELHQCNHLKDNAKVLLIEIDFSNKITNFEQIDANVLKIYKKTLCKSKELIENVNAASARSVLLQNKGVLLKNGAETIIDDLGKNDIDQLYVNALEFMKINKDNSQFNSKNMVKALLDCIKMREAVVRSDLIHQHLIMSWKIMRETNRLLKWIQALHNEVAKTSQEFIQFQIQNPSNNQSLKKVSQVSVDLLNISTNDLINDNIQLRYRIQDALNQ